MTVVDHGALFYDSMPFARTLGIELLHAGADLVRARLAWSEALCTTGGVLHGGALMALADSAGAMCAHLNLEAAASGTTTVDSSTAFMRAVREGFVEAAARPIHVGRTLIVVETALSDGVGRIVATCRQSQLVLGLPDA